MSLQLDQYSPPTRHTMDRARQQELCQNIRRLIQEHSLEAANGRNPNQSILDEALRDVWVLEQATMQP